MSEMGMVERVARALCIRAIRVARRWDTPPEELEAAIASGEAVEYAWRDFSEEAKIAIEAMRNPTAKMRRAACGAMSPGKRPTEKRVSDRAKHAIRYRAMIDAALTEPAPSTQK